MLYVGAHAGSDLFDLLEQRLQCPGGGDGSLVAKSRAFASGKSIAQPLQVRPLANPAVASALHPLR